MRRAKKADYITARISQLMDDANKAHDNRDKQWYYRICQELEWARAYEQDDMKPDCVLGGANAV